MALSSILLFKNNIQKIELFRVKKKSIVFLFCSVGGFINGEELETRHGGSGTPGFLPQANYSI